MIQLEFEPGNPTSYRIQNRYLTRWKKNWDPQTKSLRFRLSEVNANGADQYSPSESEESELEPEDPELDELELDELELELEELEELDEDDAWNINWNSIVTPNLQSSSELSSLEDKAKST